MGVVSGAEIYRPPMESLLDFGIANYLIGLA